MSLNTAETRQSFPFAYEKVFDGLISILEPAGFAVKSQDRLIGRILASAGMSGFSWGEDVAIQVQKTSDNSTDIFIQSNLKVGFNLTASSKNAQNAERIIGALSNFLQTGGRNVAESVAAAPSAQSSPVLWVIVIVVGLLVLFSILSS